VLAPGSTPWRSVRSTAVPSPCVSNPSSERKRPKPCCRSFPPTRADALATKEFLRAELSEVRVELHQLVNRLFVSLIGIMIGITGFALAVARLG
jgi:hypothetical protein